MASPNETHTQVINSLLKACTDINDFARESVNVSVKAASVWTKGLTEMVESVGNLTQNALNHSQKVTQTFSGAKNLQDVVTANSNLLKEGFENFTSELSKITQVSARTAQQAAEPITNHLNTAISKITKNKAA